MAYTAPYIDNSGLHIDTYYNLRDQLITECKNIFGQDIYLENDSQDYQWIATVSEYMYDVLQVAQLVYNNRAPNTAIKAALDSIVKINGIKRKSETYSTCTVTVTGTAGTIISNGIIYGKDNIKWDLPPSITIPNTGSIDVIATCEIAGPIVANPGDLIGIYNSTYGWNGVYNSGYATLGSYIETDSALRIRQSKSTAQPSNTMLEGTIGAIAQLEGVTRSQVYENDTGQTDSRGLPPHSITAIVENGANKDIAQAIFSHKGIGCYTNGNVSVDITDTKGEITPIRFYRPTYIDIDVTINIKSLEGYTTAITDTIKTKLQAYLNSMKIGADLTLSALWGTALSAMADLSNPNFSITSITAAKHGTSQSSNDISINFNEVCRGNINYITANVV